MRQICILGPGRMGGALAIAISKSASDLQVTQLIARNTETAKTIADQIEPLPTVTNFEATVSVDADIVLITTGDPDIRAASEWLASRVTPETAILHTSGSLASTELAACAAEGCPIGSVHPLVPISSSQTGSKLFAGAYFCIEGDADAVAFSEKLVTALGGNQISIDTTLKPLYHAAAVTSAGHIVALFSVAVEMLNKCGVDPAEAHRVLLPLTRSAVHNLESQPSESALTGSYARLDIAAFERHLTSFEGQLPPQLIELFLLLSERSVALAERAGCDPERAAALKNRINMAKSKAE